MANICVFCASGQAIEARWFALADEVGAAVAGRGHKVVSGGGRVGMMGALVEGGLAGPAARPSAPSPRAWSTLRWPTSTRTNSSSPTEWASPRKIVRLDVDGFYQGLVDLADHAGQSTLPGGGLAMVRVARTVDEALDEVERFV